jgi:hypothetical protein
MPLLTFYPKSRIFIPRQSPFPQRSPNKKFIVIFLMMPQKMAPLFMRVSESFGFGKISDANESFSIKINGMTNQVTI